MSSGLSAAVSMNFRQAMGRTACGNDKLLRVDSGIEHHQQVVILRRKRVFSRRGGKQANQRAFLIAVQSTVPPAALNQVTSGNPLGKRRLAI